MKCDNCCYAEIEGMYVLCTLNGKCYNQEVEDETRLSKRI